MAQRRIEIYAFLEDKINRQSLIENIKLLRGIADVRYVSKEQALVELKNDLGENASLIDALGTNPLPASLRIQLESGSRNLDNLEKIEEKITMMPGIKEIWSGKQILRRLDKAIRLVLGLDIALLIIIAISIIFISFQTIESTILLRSREIEIMRLVGANESTVRAPFHVEGMTQGVVGGFIAFLLITGFYYFISRQFPIPAFSFPLILGINVGFGCILGLIGSHIALNTTTIK
jgi:cell division transport system permease protein